MIRKSKETWSEQRSCQGNQAFSTHSSPVWSSFVSPADRAQFCFDWWAHVCTCSSGRREGCWDYFLTCIYHLLNAHSTMMTAMGCLGKSGAPKPQVNAVELNDRSKAWGLESDLQGTESHLWKGKLGRLTVLLSLGFLEEDGNATFSIKRLLNILSETLRTMSRSYQGSGGGDKQ